MIINYSGEALATETKVSQKKTLDVCDNME